MFVQGTKLIVNLCTERINLRNFWWVLLVLQQKRNSSVCNHLFICRSGRWQSRWEIDLTANPVSVKGKIELHVHYFENGNLQLQNERVVEEQAKFSSPQGLGDAVLRVVKEAEDNLQTNLEDMYINMSQETFKEMRRVMPGEVAAVDSPCVIWWLMRICEQLLKRRWSGAFTCTVRPRVSAESNSVLKTHSSE